MHGQPFPLGRRAQLPVNRGMQRETAIALVAGCTVIGGMVRFAVTRGLSVDELKVINQARLPLGSLVKQVVHVGGYPPLHPILAWLSLHVFGDSDLGVRLPSLIAGVALIPAVAWLGAELFDRRTAVVAALFTAVAPVLVWYSQEARDYSLAALFGTLAIVGAVRISKRGDPSDWVLHTIAAALTVWSDWFGIFIVLGTEIVLAGALRRRRRAGAPRQRFIASWLVGTAALACQLIPLALLAAKQGHNGLGGFSASASVGASGVSFYTTFSNVSWALFGFHPAAVTSVLSAVWPLLMLFTLLMVGRGVSHRPFLLAGFAMLPVLGLFVLALFAPGTFDVRYLVVAVPPVLLLWARMVTGWPRSRTGAIVAAAGVMALLTGALVDQQLDPRNPRRYDYKPALARVQAQRGTSGTVLFEPRSLRSAFARYAPGVRARPLTTHLPSRSEAGSVQVVTSFTDQPRYRALRDREIGALRATRHFVSRHRYPGVDVWWFK